MLTTMKRRTFYPRLCAVFSLLALAGASAGCSTDLPSGPAPSGATGSATGSPGSSGATTGVSSTTGASTGTAGSGGGGSGAGSAGTGSATTGGGGTSSGQDGGGSDAAVSDGGPAGNSQDGGASDAAAPDGAPAGNGCATALFCDNFDSYTAPGNPGGMWKSSTQSGGTLSVDTLHAYSGKNAVHVMDPGTAAYERAFISLEGAPIFPLPHDTMFGRMMIYVTKVPTTTVHYSLISGEGSMVPGFPNLTAAYYRYGAQINGNQFLAQYDNQPSGMSDCAQRSQVAVPQNKWSCVEWRFDGELKEMDFWLNGTIIPALSVRQKAPNGSAACQNRSWSGIWEPPTFDAIRMGWQHYQQGPGEAWIDDVGIDTKRIGCPP
jgi:hypothetical protein